MNEPLELELTGPLAIISLNNPPLNIFNLELRDELIQALQAVNDIDDVKAMVLRAEGRHFGAGADLSEFGTAASIFEARRIRWDRDPWGLLWDLRVPTIAALHGTALGSGLEMSLLCDYRVAAPDTRLGLPETKLGMLPAAGGTQTLTRAIGPHAALPLTALASTIDVTEALARGIVDEIAPDVDAQASVRAEQLALLDPQLVRAARRAIRAGIDLDLGLGLGVEKQLAQALARAGRQRPTPS